MNTQKLSCQREQSKYLQREQLGNKLRPDHKYRYAGKQKRKRKDLHWQWFLDRSLAGVVKLVVHTSGKEKEKQYLCMQSYDQTKRMIIGGKKSIADVALRKR